MAPVKIELRRGDITKTEADVCVSSIHRTKDLRKGPLAKCVLQACGSSVQDELYERSPGKDLENGQVESTSPGEMHHTKSLMFICLYQWRPGNEKVLLNSILECLELAAVVGYKTIAFPALGMGGQKYPSRKVASALIEAVALHNLQYSDDFKEEISHSLERVYIVLLDEQEDVIRTFLQMCLAATTEIEDDEDVKVHSASHHGSASASESFNYAGSQQPSGGGASQTGGTQAGKKAKKDGGAQPAGGFALSSLITQLIQMVAPAVASKVFSAQYGYFHFNVRPTMTKQKIGIGLNAYVDVGFFTEFLPAQLKKVLPKGNLLPS